MTKFEQYLIDNGYLKFRLNCKTMKYETTDSHTISSLENLDHRYFNKSDIAALELINKGVSVMSKEWEGKRANEIVFGLSEVGKPPTLIHPRPKIKVKRIQNGQEVIENEQFDDSMNVVLKVISFKEILTAMYDKSKTLEIDLTK